MDASEGKREVAECGEVSSNPPYDRELYSGRLTLPPPKVSSLHSGLDRYDAGRAVFFFLSAIDDVCAAFSGRGVRATGVGCGGGGGLLCVQKTPLWPFCGCVDRGVPLLWVGSETRRSVGEVLE